MFTFSVSYFKFIDKVRRGEIALATSWLRKYKVSYFIFMDKLRKKMIQKVLLGQLLISISF